MTKGIEGLLGNQHERLVEFAGRMENSWWKLKSKHEVLDGDWRKLKKPVLVEIHAQISGLIQECAKLQNGLGIRPSSEGKANNIADGWAVSLIRQNDIIKKLIGKES